MGDRSLLYEIGSFQRSMFHGAGQSIHRSRQVNPSFASRKNGERLLFSAASSDYPCDLPSVLTLTLANVGSPRMHVHELALRLMVVLCKGHLSESQPTITTTTTTTTTPTVTTTTMSQSSNGIPSSDDIAYIISLASNYSKSQMMLSEYLSRRRPDLTMAMFSGTENPGKQTCHLIPFAIRNHHENSHCQC
jgi:hypothetical protein